MAKDRPIEILADELAIPNKIPFVEPAVAEARASLEIYLTHKLHGLDNHLLKWIELARLPTFFKPVVDRLLNDGEYHLPSQPQYFDN